VSSSPWNLVNIDPFPFLPEPPRVPPCGAHPTICLEIPVPCFLFFFGWDTEAQNPRSLSSPPLLISGPFPCGGILSKDPCGPQGVFLEDFISDETGPMSPPFLIFFMAYLLESV